MTFNEYVKTTRIKLNITASELSRISKISRATIYGIENNGRNPEPSTRARITEAFRYIERNERKPVPIGTKTIYPVKCYKLNKAQLEYYRSMPVRLPPKGYRYWEYEAEHDQWRNEVFER